MLKTKEERIQYLTSLGQLLAIMTKRTIQHQHFYSKWHLSFTISAFLSSILWDQEAEVI